MKKKPARCFISSHDYFTFRLGGYLLRFFPLHLIGRETKSIPEIFSGVHGFMGKTVTGTSELNAGGNPAMD